MNAAPAARRLERRITTPEGIPLRVELARAGDRAGAFLFDFVILLGAGVVLGLVVAWATGWQETWSLAIGLLLFFLLRTFYFTWFEIRWQGRTPGKRAVGTRVMDAAGGPLRSEAVVVRNLMRELELWIPLVFLIAGEQVWPGAPGWARLGCSLWAIGLALLPLFNRNRLRVGDMVAGTVVVLAPRAVLLPDLGAAAGKEQVYSFTDAQLEVYGIYELQVLEDVLRRTEGADAHAAVAAQIRKKIGWQGDVQAERFLREFYAALRARLERKLLLGKRKKDKFAKG